MIKVLLSPAELNVLEAAVLDLVNTTGKVKARTKSDDKDYIKILNESYEHLLALHAKLIKAQKTSRQDARGDLLIGGPLSFGGTLGGLP